MKTLPLKLLPIVAIDSNVVVCPHEIEFDLDSGVHFLLL